MPRIPFPEVETMTPAQLKVYRDVVDGPRGLMVGPLRAALHNAELADKWQQFGQLLRYQTSLPPRHSELAILVTARAWDCPFEWVQHEPPARSSGLSDGIIEAIRLDRRPAFERRDDEIIYTYAKELHDRHGISDAVYAEALSLIGTVGVVELTALIGYYTLVAMTLNAHAFDLPAGSADPFREAAE
ncbi:carboxymuconolactone decarboxylase [Sphingomonas sp. Root50]|nr:carboxymuconolactone decarboxylase [Sphingomonas sp. Root1294]KQY66197.1 carboxymuconolactone decarboxylase [Sphingomonas sp. Root50]KRB89874.1 carboxymuconolactone decarboxylase [Sphingomonas sp. Root720]